MSTSHIRNIAVIGATGNLGSRVVKHLLEAQQFNVTAISRSSSSTLPKTSPTLKVLQGDYTSPTFLASAFSNIEAVIFTLHHSAVPSLEIALIEAATAAGVKWILPVEYGNDPMNEELVSAVPILSKKIAPRRRIEELAENHEGLKWIGIVTNPWFDFSMKLSMFQINVKNRTALLLSGGTTKFNTTNLNTVALGISRLFTLPIESEEGPSLSSYSNQCLYLSSFRTSQRDILSAFQRATGTTDDDWKITHTDVDAFIAEGAEKLAKGNFSGMVNLLYGITMKDGAGGDYEGVKGLDNAVLGLPKEDLDESARLVLSDLLV